MASTQQRRAPQSRGRSGFQKWKDGIVAAKGNPKWDKWDCDIQRIVTAYNHHLLMTASAYQPLDWRVIKAMLWVESGPHQPDWNTQPMQIGNAGDPGLRDFFERGGLILPPVWKGRFDEHSAKINPEHNLVVGIGYLLLRLAYFQIRSVPDEDTKVYEATVQKGDSFDSIARKQGTTVDKLKELNPKVNPRQLSIGQVLKYQKASVQWVISGWEPITSTAVAQYNGKGDKTYTKRFEFAYSVVTNRVTPSCEQ
jgi:hypothetical protein